MKEPEDIYFHHICIGDNLNTEIIEFFLTCKDNPNIQGSLYKTPFHHACENKNITLDIFLLFTSYGAIITPEIINFYNKLKKPTDEQKKIKELLIPKNMSEYAEIFAKKANKELTLTNILTTAYKDLPKAARKTIVNQLWLFKRLKPKINFPKPVQYIIIDYSLVNMKLQKKTQLNQK